MDSAQSQLPVVASYSEAAQEPIRYDAPKAYRDINKQEETHLVSPDVRRYLHEQGILGYDHTREIYYIAMPKYIAMPEGLSESSSKEEIKAEIARNIRTAVANIDQFTSPWGSKRLVPDAQVLDARGKTTVSNTLQERRITLIASDYTKTLEFLRSLQTELGTMRDGALVAQGLPSILDLHSAVRDSLGKTSYLAEAWRLKDRDWATLNKTGKVSHVAVALFKQSIAPFQAIWKSNDTILGKIASTLLGFPFLLTWTVLSAVLGTLVGIGALIGKAYNAIEAWVKANPDKAKRILIGIVVTIVALGLLYCGLGLPFTLAAIGKLAGASLTKWAVAGLITSAVVGIPALIGLGMYIQKKRSAEPEVIGDSERDDTSSTFGADNMKKSSVTGTRTETEPLHNVHEPPATT